MKIGLFFLTLFLGIQAITLADCIVANLSVPPMQISWSMVPIENRRRWNVRAEFAFYMTGPGAIMKPQFFFFLSTTVRSANCLVSATVDGAYRRKYGSAG